MYKNRKIISIEEVENGFVMTYNITGSGQQVRMVTGNVDGVKHQIKLWLDHDESPPDANSE